MTEWLETFQVAVGSQLGYLRDLAKPVESSRPAEAVTDRKDAGSRAEIAAPERLDGVPVAAGYLLTG